MTRKERHLVLRILSAGFDISMIKGIEAHIFRRILMMPKITMM
jgi:hypothetical protein